jgi:hypothetical protein
VALIRTINDSTNTAIQGAAFRKSCNIGLARDIAEIDSAVFVSIQLKRLLTP